MNRYTGPMPPDYDPTLCRSVTRQDADKRAHRAFVRGVIFGGVLIGGIFIAAHVMAAV